VLLELVGAPLRNNYSNHTTRRFCIGMPSNDACEPRECLTLVCTCPRADLSFRLPCRAMEFKTFSATKIKAILLVNNYDFGKSRQGIILATTPRPWRNKVQTWFSSSKLLSSRTPRHDLDHLLRFLPTGSDRLDTEIGSIIEARRTAEQLLTDADLARRLAEAENTPLVDLVECECCYADVPWDQICHCSSLHYFCHGCLRRTVQEDIYGQGRALDRGTGSVRCFSSSAGGGCEAVVPRELLLHALPQELLRAIDERLAKDAQGAFAGDEILRCPFCPFAVFDVHVAPPPATREARPRFWTRHAGLVRRADITLMWILTAFVALCIVLCPPLPLIGLLISTYALLCAQERVILQPFDAIRHPLSSFLRQMRVTLQEPPGVHPSPGPRQSKRLPRFTCHNPTCAKISCLDCGKEWIGTHSCAVGERERKRLFVEHALAEAVKRTVCIPLRLAPAPLSSIHLRFPSARVAKLPSSKPAGATR
jgi:hypothetical protein